MKVLLALALAGFVPPLSGASQVITVDDDGPADFSDIQPAIDAAAPGDVILVHPGGYQAFTLAKRVHIMGASGPALQELQGFSKVLAGAEHFEISGLLFSGDLRIDSVSGRGRLDDVWTEDTDSDLVIVDCESIELSRMRTYGRVAVTSSAVSITSSILQGAHGPGGFACGVNGMHGLELGEQSFAWIADTTLKGGGGGSGGSACCDGDGGHGLVLNDASAALVRGQPDNLIAGGLADIGYCGVPGVAVLAQEGSRAVISGVTVGEGGVVIEPGSELMTPSTPEPWIRITAPDDTGVRRVQMFGEAGVPIALAASFAKTTLELPSLLEAPLWVSPSALVFLETFQLTGFGAPVGIDVAAADPALYGLALGIQAVCPTLSSVLQPGTLIVSNPTTLVFQP